MCLHIVIQIFNNVSFTAVGCRRTLLALELCDAVVLDESGASCACLREREVAVAVVDAVRSSNALFATLRLLELCDAVVLDESGSLASICQSSLFYTFGL